MLALTTTIRPAGYGMSVLDLCAGPHVVQQLHSWRRGYLEEIAALVLAAAEGVDLGETWAQQTETAHRILNEAATAWGKERGLAWDPARAEHVPPRPARTPRTKAPAYPLPGLEAVTTWYLAQHESPA